MKRKSSLSHLPTELLEDILCRLRGKNIVQLRCVCKTWYEILTHPSLISMHADWCAKNLNGYLVNIFHDGSHISRLDKSFDFSEKLEFPINSSVFRLVGSCDGLLCMREMNPKKHHFPSTYLWNPSIRALKKLPDTTYHHQQDVVDALTFWVSAFGFDRRTNDCKVFHIVREKLNKEEEAYVINNRLYSLKTDSWKVIQGIDDMSSYPSGYLGCRSYFNGAFYWIQYRKYPSSSRLMLWFDFCDETIQKTKLPIDYDDRRNIISIGPFNNSLVLYISDARIGRDLCRGPCRIDTWVMRTSDDGRTWDRQLSVVIPAPLAWPLSPGFNVGEILVYKYFCLNSLTLHYQFGVYDFKKQNFRQVDTHVLGDPTIVDRVKGSFTYSESLFLLEEAGKY